MKHLFRSSLFCLCFFSSQVLALSLGQMQLKSSLNQPFKAEIPLKSLHQVALDEIKVKLGSVAEFKQLSIDRPHVLTQLTFNVKKNSQGQAVIELASSRSINEPYLQLLVDVSWPQGRLNKSYTALLDPPYYALNTTQNTQNAPTVEQPVHLTLPDLSQGTTLYGPVKAKQSLWNIARSLSKDQPVSTAQMMIGILKANPKAFILANINGLRVGTELRIPAIGQIQKINLRQSLQFVKQQNQWWKQGVVTNETSPSTVESPVESPENERRAIETAQTSSETEHAVLPQIIELQPEEEADNRSMIFKSAQSENRRMLENLQTELDWVTKSSKALQTTNRLLQEQINWLKTQNHTLLTNMQDREQQIQALKEQLTQLVLQQTPAKPPLVLDRLLEEEKQTVVPAVAGQVSELLVTTVNQKMSSLWIWGLLALLTVGLVGWKRAFLRELLERKYTRIQPKVEEAVVTPRPETHSETIATEPMFTPMEINKTVPSEPMVEPSDTMNTIQEASEPMAEPSESVVEQPVDKTDAVSEVPETTVNPPNEVEIISEPDESIDALVEAMEKAAKPSESIVAQSNEVAQNESELCLVEESELEPELDIDYQLNLATAYINTGENAEASKILKSILPEADEKKQKEIRRLLDELQNEHI